MLTGTACGGHVRYVVLLSGQRGLDYSACDRFCGRIKVGLCIRRYYTIILVGEPATKLMHPKYTNVKYAFSSIKIYE